MAHPRTPGVVYAALTVALLLVLAFVALTTRQTPPPTIAEFAPQAVENITDSPSDQSSHSGREGGLGAGALQTPSPEPTAPAGTAISVPRVRKCIGDPPRQIEDPQSPPCVPYWSGDNGGATSKGVTRDEIRIIQSSGNTTLWASFFNKRFEFYGRKIVIVPLGNPDGGEPPAQRASAARADEELHGFASMTQVSNGGYFYGEELARRGILYSSTAPVFDEDGLRTRAPYVWQYQMGNDRMFGMLGELGCKQLVGRPAGYAGDPVLAQQQRQFGVVVWQSYVEWEENPAPLVSALERCGARPKVVGFALDADEAAAGNQLVKMRNDGVTSIFCLCNATTAWDNYTATATSQGYMPEWIISNYWGLDELGRQTGTPDQWSHSFGLSANPMSMRDENEPYVWASNEMNPAYNDDANDTPLGRWTQRTAYRSLLVLASGIQMAGPILTPETFESGLQRTRFPNPKHMLKAGDVGFGGRGGVEDPRDHTMTDDVAAFWMSVADSSPYADGGQGATCYLAGGARFIPGSIPSDEMSFFSPPCLASAEDAS